MEKENPDTDKISPSHSERTKRLRRRIEEKLRNEFTDEQIVALARQLGLIRQEYIKK